MLKKRVLSILLVLASLLGFAAEQARHNGTVEDMDAFMAAYGFENKY